MTITIDLPPATIKKLHAQAAASGKDVETFVREAVEARLVVTGLTFRQILEPIHQEAEASGISEEELTSMADQEVAATPGEHSHVKAESTVGLFVPT